MALLAQQPDGERHHSLQINIDSEWDAKAVIQHLQAIKNRYDILAESGLVDSIEFCIASPIRRLVDSDLMAAVRWCRTWLRSVAPFEGNVHFALPHYAPSAPRPLAPIAFANPVPLTVSEAALPTPVPIAQPHGKSKRLVSAEMAPG